MVNTVSTGCPSLDKTMGNGLPMGQLTLVYGESNTGKTTLAIQCAVVSARNGLKTIFIDSDNTFSPTRLSQIAYRDVASVSPLIFVLKPHTFHEQSLLIENLSSYLTKDVVFIVVDTITSLYRAELESIEKIFSLNRELNRQLAYLGETAKTHNVAVLIVSQVRDIFRGKESNKLIEPVATRVLKFWPQNILCLNNAFQPLAKEAIVEKSFNPSHISSSCYYVLNKMGIIDLD